MSNMSDEAMRYAVTRVAQLKDLFTPSQLDLLEVVLAAAHVAGAKFATDLVASAWQEVKIPLHPFKPIEEVEKS